MRRPSAVRTEVTFYSVFKEVLICFPIFLFIPVKVTDRLALASPKIQLWTYIQQSIFFRGLPVVNRDLPSPFFPLFTAITIPVSEAVLPKLGAKPLESSCHFYLSSVSLCRSTEQSRSSYFFFHLEQSTLKTLWS